MVSYILPKIWLPIIEMVILYLDFNAYLYASGKKYKTYTDAVFLEGPKFCTKLEPLWFFVWCSSGYSKA